GPGCALAARARAAKSSVVAVLTPERRLRERLAGWSAHDEQRFVPAYVGKRTKFAAAQCRDIGFKNLPRLLRGVCSQRRACHRVRVDMEAQFCPRCGCGEAETARSSEKIDGWHSPHVHLSGNGR